VGPAFNPSPQFIPRAPIKSSKGSKEIGNLGSLFKEAKRPHNLFGGLGNSPFWGIGIKKKLKTKSSPKYKPGFAPTTA